MPNDIDLTKNGNNELDDASLKDLLKDLVNEAIKYNRQQSRLIKEFMEKKILKGKYTFRFPFILKENHITGFQDCIERRLRQEYNDDYELKFKCTVEFKNNDKLVYKEMNDFFQASHKEEMLRVQLDWTYIIYEVVEGINLPIEYDIIIFYEIEQDTDQRELLKVEEWGAIQVEGHKNDWINGTLNELKILTEATKMPFWWYYPKKVELALREYIHILFWILGFVLVIQIILPFLNSTNTSNIDFMEKASLITDASEKLQAYIEYTLEPSDDSNSFISMIVFFIVPFITTVILTKISRYIFPPSMILIGCTQSKLKNKLIAYSFIWGAIVTSIIGFIAVMLIN